LTDLAEQLPDHLAASIAGTLQHIGLIQQKEARLAAARWDALVQVLHRIGTEYRTGQLTDAQMCTALHEIRSLDMSGRMNAWDEIVGVSWKHLAQLSLRLPNGPEGSWVGEYPFPAGALTPMPGTAVVYVLFDEANDPCYVGSTHKFRARMNRHAKDGKRFVRWQAHPCRDREHAYELEDRLLKRRKPPLNQKASR
jgi:predicted GIY-YIG superfamily endonuclease